MYFSGHFQDISVTRINNANKTCALLQMNPRHLGTWTSRYSVLDISALTWTVRDFDETIFLTDHNCLVLINCQYFCTSSSLIYMNQKCF